MAINVAAELPDRTYEGPFDLLLQLILAEEVDIHEVSLARIVDAYLAEIERMQSLDLDVATEFLLIAATLVELKARRLLPGRADVDLDDELALWEERDLLLARLLECKTFKDVSRLFGSLADDAGRSFARRVGPDERFAGLAARPARRRDDDACARRGDRRARRHCRHRGSTSSTSPRSGRASPTRSPSSSTSCRAPGGSRSPV